MSNKVAFMFPGQGSQFVGMGKALHEAFPAAREVFGVADEALGFELSTLCFSGDLEELTRTENTQPALLTVSVAVQRVLASRGVVPGVLAGHSLGEYSALVAAGSIDLADAVRLVRSRGAYMQQAVPEGAGAMAAILGLDDAAVENACADAAAATGAVVSPANYNSPGQVVVAGARAAVEAAAERAREAGARRALLLNVSAPFHCALMRPAAERLAGDLGAARFVSPAVPVICNVDAVPLTDAAEIASALERQVTAPVRWVQDVQCMAAMGAEVFVEVGPGKVLSGLMKRILDKPQVLNAHEPEEIETVVNALAG